MRPECERLNADIRGGLIDAIACWHMDRLTRSPRELEDVIDRHDQHSVQVATAPARLTCPPPERRRRQPGQAAQAAQSNGGQSGRGYTHNRTQIVTDLNARGSRPAERALDQVGAALRHSSGDMIGRCTTR